MSKDKSNRIDISDMLAFVEEISSYLHIKEIDPSELIFEERVKMNCFNCGKYYTNWKCPGNMPQNINYEKMVKEYKNGAFVYLKMPIGNDKYDEVRVESSNILHKSLLKMEQYLWNHDEAMALSFIGGSCKLCKNGCGIERCNNPYRARSPIEAIGINVIQSAALYGIDITFPPKEFMFRIGMILW